MFIAIELDRSRISAFDRFFCLFQRECMSLRTIDIAFFIRLHPIAPEPVLVRDLFLFFVHGLVFHIQFDFMILSRVSVISARYSKENSLRMEKRQGSSSFLQYRLRLCRRSMIRIHRFSRNFFVAFIHTTDILFALALNLVPSI